MRVTASRKKAVSALAVVALAAVAVALVAYPALAVGPLSSQDDSTVLNDENWSNVEQFIQTENVAVQLNNVTAEARGWAFQRIDNETIKQYSMTMNLALELGQRNGPPVAIVNVSGSVEVNSVTYAIESGKGLIATRRDIALFRAEGVDGQGNNVTLKVAAKYFWWGGQLYAFRGKALLQTTEKPMLLLFRGMAKVH